VSVRAIVLEPEIQLDIAEILFKSMLPGNDEGSFRLFAEAVSKDDSIKVLNS